MATYTELVAQAQAIMAQAQQVRKTELAGVIAEIQAKMKEYDLKISDIDAGSVPRKASKSRSTAPAKYRGPNGELWSGGPGRKPEWVRKVLAEGKDLGAYLI